MSTPFVFYEELPEVYTVAANDIMLIWDTSASRMKRSTVSQTLQQKMKERDARWLSERLAAWHRKQALNWHRSREPARADGSSNGMFRPP